MVQRDVTFIAFLEQDNLGIGYITSMLIKHGYRVELVDFRLGKYAILQNLLRTKPLIVGFSVIFQYHIKEFHDLILFLRRKGVRAHFCAGGHFPSLRPRQLLEIIPDLDSVVLFEGEWTFLELTKAVFSNNDWRQIRGIAIQNNGDAVINQFRPLESDLDKFPPPFRPPLKNLALEKKYATLLAGRGCVYDCSFCSIRQFYSRPAGSLKRLRRPDMVVREMELLRDKMGCSIYMFQDDDFPVARPWGSDWSARYCKLLQENGLATEILWKINCRPDEIEEQLFKQMKNCGLFLVYLGIENGTESGLRLMNKHVQPHDNIDGALLLKELEINYDFGFMLFDPSSTLVSVQKNLDFLETLCGDGSSPITFCKMRPYAETSIEAMLREQGRLKGRVGFEDYEFLDEKVTVLYNLVNKLFAKWIGAHDGVLNMARWARYYLAVYRKYYCTSKSAEDLETRTTAIIQQSNHFLLETVERACSLSLGGKPINEKEFQIEMEEDVRKREQKWQVELEQVIKETEAGAIPSSLSNDLIKADTHR